MSLGRTSRITTGTESTRTDEPCPSCGRLAVAVFGQSAYSGRLVWWCSWSCEGCGALESDDFGFPPSGYRDRIIAREGLWEFTVHTESARDKAMVGLVLKELLELTPREAAQMAKAVPVWRGTRVEVQWICMHLARRGIECVQQQSPAGARG